ncbi:GntR family transcriptional regulator [Paracoccus benzoatiresistens]|uniref:GntR family transcriptional regulator n=1 Tax=Paracoccus benzoatiresistens TaxID=2997341 RepID=A0ABT4J0V1_9RHOB|nr:GntR family transcriptional regulator [Paracoccus sp. EF6]MCZ0960750.1 GntR family transcriptional regulator [Paracoccus sp. EF6]
MAPELKPILARRTMAGEVYSQLRAALMEGVFETGDSFAISDLAQRFGTSNTPVREALRRLTDEGALIEGKWNSATLPGLSAAGHDQLCKARKVIEGGAAELAADTITPDELAALRDISHRHQSALLDGRVEDMLAANKDFHFTIYRAARSPILLEQIENLWLRSGPYTRFLSEKMRDILKADVTLSHARNHDHILAALEARDGAATRRAMMDDISSVRDWMAAFLKDA